MDRQFIIRLIMVNRFRLWYRFRGAGPERVGELAGNGVISEKRGTMGNQKQVIDWLKEGRKQLIQDFLAGDAPDFLGRQTRLLDDYLREICRVLDNRPALSPRDPYAIVALGGYGRGEMCIHSDVDLLFLFDAAIPENAVDFIRAVVYPLWDLGLYVSHNARILAEPVALPDGAVSSLTALLDARFVAGAPALFSAFKTKFRTELVEPQAQALIDWLIETNRERHDHFGDSSYLLEPNLKEGQGGLRDYQTLMWVARIQRDLRESRELESYGYLSHEEYHELTRALGFIWMVRNHLHHLAGKKHDRFGFEYQKSVADLLGYVAQEGQQPVERFLGRLQEEMSFLKDLHLMFVYELESLRGNTERAAVPGAPAPGLQIHRGMLRFDSPQAVLNDPALLMRIFEESGRLQLPLGIEAKRLVKNMRRYLTDSVRSSPEVVASFETILSAPPFRFTPLNEMLWTGLLTRFIPQLEAIRHRIQYDQYHLHPVDKHSLKVVRTLKLFGGPSDPSHGRLCGELYAALPDWRPLLWAALLHDIGKGESGGDHAKKGPPIAAEILKELGYDEDLIETVSLLIREHLLLAKTATRRDIHDEETAIFCARRVQDPERLKMLYLLTVADSIATGPKAWNDWSLSLIQGLYFYTLRLLEQGELASKEAVERVEAKKTALIRLTTTPEERAAVEAVMPFMSPRYLLFAEPSEMLVHVNLHKLMGAEPFAWKIEKKPDPSTRTVTICAKDKPGLFSKISGVFTLNGIDILNAQIYTWRNNAALDIFRVKPPPDPIFEVDKWEKAAHHLQEAIEGRLDLCAEVKERIGERRRPRSSLHHRPTKVVIDNRSSSYFTIVEVFAYDFTGLLFLITEALFRLELDVWLAKIATQVDQVVDVFYVRDFNGQKVDDPEAEATIRRTIIEAIGA